MSESVQQSIPLVLPLNEGEKPPSGEVVLVACDGKTRFGVNEMALKRFSKFIESVLSGDTDEEIPLDTDRAPPHAVQLLATWVRHHETSPPSQVKIPLPRVSMIEELFSNPWDLIFIRNFVGREEDMTKCQPLYDLALLSVYLQIQPLTEILATFFAFAIRRGIHQTGEPTRLVRRWFGKAGDYTAEELSEMTEWLRGACDGMMLPKPAKE